MMPPPTTTALAWLGNSDTQHSIFMTDDIRWAQLATVVIGLCASKDRQWHELLCNARSDHGVFCRKSSRQLVNVTTGIYQHTCMRSARQARHCLRRKALNLAKSATRACICSPDTVSAMRWRCLDRQASWCVDLSGETEAFP